MEPSAEPRREWFDLSLPIDTKIPVYPGDPPVQHQLATDYNVGGYRLSTWCLGSHTGTHVDAPSHFLPGGPGVDTLSIEALIGDAYVVDVRHRGSSDEILLSDLPSFRLPKRLLFCSGWDQHCNVQDYFFGVPGLSGAVVEELIAQGVLLIGTDAPNIHATEWAPLHRQLLAAGIVIVERLKSLDRFAGMRVELVVAPLCLVDSDGAPARVFARVLEA